MTVTAIWLTLPTNAHFAQLSTSLHAARLISADNMPRLTRKNTGQGEWSTHCVDCLPLAKLAQQGNHLPLSAKIRMILELLKQIDKQSQGEEKTIIFSQFTSMLDLIEPFLRERGINYVRCDFRFFAFNLHCRLMVSNIIDDGSMSNRARDLMIQQIRSNRSVRVMLVSTKAGGIGKSTTPSSSAAEFELTLSPYRS